MSTNKRKSLVYTPGMRVRATYPNGTVIEGVLVESSGDWVGIRRSVGDSILDIALRDGTPFLESQIEILSLPIPDEPTEFGAFVKVGTMPFVQVGPHAYQHHHGPNDARSWVGSDGVSATWKWIVKLSIERGEPIIVVRDRLNLED